jgi:hypothetical protein
MSIRSIRRFVWRISGALLLAAALAAVGLPVGAQGMYAPYPYPYPVPPFTVRVPPPVYVPPPPVVYAVPSGAVPVRVGNVIFYSNAGLWYSPRYYGPNVVYAQVPPPY